MSSLLQSCYIVTEITDWSCCAALTARALQKNMNLPHGRIPRTPGVRETAKTVNREELPASIRPMTTRPEPEAGRPIRLHPGRPGTRPD